MLVHPTLVLLFHILVFQTQAQEQILLPPMPNSPHSNNWQVEVAKEWDVLGPFPIHAREQHYISPAFPLNLSEAIDLDRKWPSTLSDGGEVGWSTAVMNEDRELMVSFPEIRWKYLRSFEGWAALQHHSVLRATIRLIPPAAQKASEVTKWPNLMVTLTQGSYFTILPAECSATVVPRWHSGNIYDLPRSLPQSVELPRSITGEFQLFVSGDYEIRLFGDPLVQEGSEVPVLKIKLHIGVEETISLFIREPSQDVLCDFVEGFAFGTVIGIGLRSTTGWISVTKATLTQNLDGLEVQLAQMLKLAPGQTRVIPLVIRQRSPLEAECLEIALFVESATSKAQLKVSLPLRQLPRWMPNSRIIIRASFLYAFTNPTVFTVLPPRLAGEGAFAHPILALHGAGVDILDHDFWAHAMPKNDLSWIIMPAGRTSWGLDWHGPSAQEAWDAVSALGKILQANEKWKNQAFPGESKVILIGHSNGGQGVWHLSTHFPDRVAAAIPAAAYIKSQAYIPLTHARFAHYMDPMLRAILESSLTPDDNDLHLSNIAHVPVLAVHGGSDKNVPAWHSRELVGILRGPEMSGKARLKEEPGQDHWYSTVLDNQDVQQFLGAHVQITSEKTRLQSFTLTVSNPWETGSLNGWKVHALIIQGRLGSLHVEVQRDGIIKVAPNNIQRFSLEKEHAILAMKELIIGSQKICRSQFTRFPVGFIRDSDQWIITPSNPLPSSVPTRLQAILTTGGPIHIVYDGEQAFSLAKRLAHDLHLYHRLDSVLISDGESVYSPSGSSVVIGTLRSAAIQHTLTGARTPFRLQGENLVLNGKTLPMNGESYIFLQPSSILNGSYEVVIIYSDEASLERAGKLFPIRTGVSGPNWLCLSPKMEHLGAAGLLGAGVWTSDWEYQQESSWLAV